MWQRAAIFNFKTENHQMYASFVIYRFILRKHDKSSKDWRLEPTLHSQLHETVWDNRPVCSNHQTKIQRCTWKASSLWDKVCYARFLHLHISTLQEAGNQHPDIWAEFTKWKFWGTTDIAGFTSIVPDRGIEQYNRKTMGGIVRLNQETLERFYLIALECRDYLIGLWKIRHWLL